MKAYFYTILVLHSFVIFSQKHIELSQVADRTFYPKSIRAVNWMNDGQYYSALHENRILKYDVRTGNPVETLVDGKALNVEIDDYAFSADEEQVLLLTERQSVYRRSYTAKYFVYERVSKKIQPLSDGRQAYASFSPDGTKIAFTRANNLFYKDLNTGKETAITTDGVPNAIINGSTDWVYEEELYLTQAYEWSVDSKKIAYYRFNEINVPRYNMQVWNDGALYPQDHIYKYPKAGEANSIITLFAFHLADGKKVQLDIGSDTDIYLPKITWTKDPDLVSVQRLNRLQNKLDVLHSSATTGASTIVLTDENDTYIDFTFCNDLRYLDNGQQFIFSSERSGYKHFYLYNMDGSLAHTITSGNFEAVELAGVDQKSKKPRLYYLSTEVSPLEQHFYTIGIDGQGKTALSSAAGRTSINMSPDCKYYISYHSSASQPLQVALFETKGNKLVKVLEDNRELAQRAQEYGFSPKEFFEFKGADGTLLNGYLLKPAGFDANQMYPVLVYQYSGPGSQDVADSWAGGHFAWHQLLTQKGYIVAVVDTRGTGYRGEAFKKVTYKQLGKFETEDLIAAGQYLGTLPFVNKHRIGVWGWSYGGYMSSLAILKGADVFKAAIAVAPVTTWRFYDTIYTERYLQRPQDNPTGYDDNSPIHHADKLKGAFLLIHGTGDDNVHFQNAVALQNALIEHGKQFESFYYPDKAHGIAGVRAHLYEMMTRFIQDNL